jgi:hypothetical protein
VKTLRSIAVLSLLAALAAAAAPPEPKEGSPHQQLLGLWEVLEIKNLDSGQVQPKNREFHMYTASHEMIILAGANRPKLQKSLSDMTAEEVMGQQPIGAGFYAYVVALSAYYEGRSNETEFEVKGDTLITRDRHSADGQLRQWTMKRVE